MPVVIDGDGCSGDDSSGDGVFKEDDEEKEYKKVKSSKDYPTSFMD